MIIGPKYKIARRLGPIFEKTQTQKYAIRSGEGSAGGRGGRTGGAGRPRAKSDYGLGMLEKQKARMSYGIPGRQFTNYVKSALAEKGNSAELLVKSLEGRLDNVALRAGFAPTRQAARQMVSHGHLTVNGKIVTIPSYQVPAWLKLDTEKREVTIDGVPTAVQSELMFNVGSVLEFYSR
jgi:small subunit ribosomal protein S4